MMPEDKRLTPAEMQPVSDSEVIEKDLPEVEEVLEEIPEEGISVEENNESSVEEPGPAGEENADEASPPADEDPAETDVGLSEAAGAGEEAAPADGDAVAEDKAAEKVKSAKAAKNPGKAGKGKKEKLVRPELPELEEELHRERYRSRYFRTMRTTIYVLLIVAAVAILIATLWMPVLQIYGSSMNPTLTNEDIVVLRSTDNIHRGEIAAFYYNNKILVKRCIGVGGDQIDIDRNGFVSVNGQPLDEPYVLDRQLGESTVNFPYTVPEGGIFVLSDNRSNPSDSRNAAIGCVTDDQILGHLVMRVWPLKALGFVD